MYSLGLVYWELARRCKYESVCQEYQVNNLNNFIIIYTFNQMPYYDVVNPDPTIEEMKVVVCDKKIRPQCPDTWDTLEVIHTCYGGTLGSAAMESGNKVLNIRSKECSSCLKMATQRQQ